MMDEYLKCDSVIDYDNKAITDLADTLFKQAHNELGFIKMACEFVRDHISRPGYKGSGEVEEK